LQGPSTLQEAKGRLGSTDTEPDHIPRPWLKACVEFQEPEERLASAELTTKVAYLRAYLEFQERSENEERLGSEKQIERQVAKYVSSSKEGDCLHKKRKRGWRKLERAWEGIKVEPK
jgi:hypothetical protein